MLKTSTTDGPEGTLSNKCLKSLEFLKRSSWQSGEEHHESVILSRVPNEIELKGTFNIER